MAGGNSPPRDGAAADPPILAESFILGLSTSGGSAEEQGGAPAVHALREDSSDQVRLVTTFMQVAACTASLRGRWENRSMIERLL